MNFLGTRFAPRSQMYSKITSTKVLYCNEIIIQVFMINEIFFLMNQADVKITYLKSLKKFSFD